MAPRSRKALGDLTNMSESDSALKSENDSLKAQLADLSAQLERTTISESKPAAAPAAGNPFGPSIPTNIAALVSAPVPPKRATNAYFFFMKEARTARASEFANKTLQETTALIAQEWKALSEDARAPFAAKAEEDKRRYQAEVAEYTKRKEDIDTERKALEMHFHQQKIATALAFYEENFGKMQEKEQSVKTTKDANAPKNPRSAYVLFCSDRRQELANKPGEKMSFPDATKMISEEWNKLKSSRAKKAVATLAKYQKRANADRERYEEEKIAYDADRARERAEKEEMERAEIERTRVEALKTYQKMAREEEAVREAKCIQAEAGRAAKEEKRRAREERRAEKAAKALLPKKPRNAYNLFSQAYRAQVVEANPQANGQEIWKELGKLWRNADASVKTRFEKEAAADKKRYQDEMAQL